MNTQKHTVTELTELKKVLQLKSHELSRKITGYYPNRQKTVLDSLNTQKEKIDKTITEIDEYLLKVALNLSFDDEPLNS